MSEITRLYKNAGIPKYGKRQCKDSEYLECQNYCFCNMDNKCDKFTFEYPPFTAEKQLALLKLLIRHSKTELYCRYANDKYKLIMYTEDYCTSDIDSFENALASVVCDVWGLLTPEEKQQVKGILK